MLVRIERRFVDVRDKACKTRPCFSLGFDKGSFTLGVGYTSYHRDARGQRVERPVCMTRMARGCPVNSVCPKCHLATVLNVRSACEHPGCDGKTEARKETPA